MKKKTQFGFIIGIIGGIYAIVSLTIITIDKIESQYEKFIRDRVEEIIEPCFNYHMIVIFAPNKNGVYTEESYKDIMPSGDEIHRCITRKISP